MNLCLAFFHEPHHQSGVLYSRLMKIMMQCFIQVISVSVWILAIKSLSSAFCMTLPLLSHSQSKLQISFILSSAGLFATVSCSCDPVFTKQFLMVTDCRPTFISVGWHSCTILHDDDSLFKTSSFFFFYFKVHKYMYIITPRNVLCFLCFILHFSACPSPYVTNVHQNVCHYVSLCHLFTATYNHKSQNNNNTIINNHIRQQ